MVAYDNFFKSSVKIFYLSLTKTKFPIDNYIKLITAKSDVSVLFSFIGTYPAKMAPKSAMNHSGELNPKIQTPWWTSSPS